MATKMDNYIEARNPLSAVILESRLSFGEIAVICLSLCLSFVFHAIGVAVIPWEIEGRENTLESAGDQIVELVLSEEEPEAELQRFVETNPDLPSNEPDETENFAARSQQAAQLNPSESEESNMPKIDGDMENAHKVVSGELMEEPVIAQEAAGELAAEEAEPIVLQNPPALPPAPAFTQVEEESEEGAASLLPKPEVSDEQSRELSEENSIDMNLDETVRTTNDSNSKVLASVEGTQTKKPRPRPKVAPQVISGPVIKSEGNVAPFKGAALNAKFSEFGDYQQKMVEVIGTQWLGLVRNVEQIRDEVSSFVVVEFSINRKGEVVTQKIVHSTSGRIAEILCLDAINSRAPFGEWTDDMISTLNEEETIRFKFYYNALR